MPLLRDAHKYCLTLLLNRPQSNTRHIQLPGIPEVEGVMPDPLEWCQLGRKQVFPTPLGRASTWRPERGPPAIRKRARLV